MLIKKEDFLTDQEIEIVLESIVLWEDKDFAKTLMTRLLETVVPPDDLKQYKIQKEKSELKDKEEKKIRIKRAIFLKAKLLKLRDMLRSENLCEGVDKP